MIGHGRRVRRAAERRTGTKAPAGAKAGRRRAEAQTSSEMMP